MKEKESFIANLRVYVLSILGATRGKGKLFTGKAANTNNKAANTNNNNTNNNNTRGGKAVARGRGRGRGGAATTGVNRANYNSFGNQKQSPVKRSVTW